MSPRRDEADIYGLGARADKYGRTIKPAAPKKIRSPLSPSSTKITKAPVKKGNIIEKKIDPRNHPTLFPNFFQTISSKASAEKKRKEEEEKKKAAEKKVVRPAPLGERTYGTNVFNMKPTKAAAPGKENRRPTDSIPIGLTPVAEVFDAGFRSSLSAELSSPTPAARASAPKKKTLRAAAKAQSGRLGVGKNKTSAAVAAAKISAIAATKPRKELEAKVTKKSSATTKTSASAAPKPAKKPQVPGLTGLFASKVAGPRFRID